jgi:hypothetical protein
MKDIDLKSIFLKPDRAGRLNCELGPIRFDLTTRIVSHHEKPVWTGEN